MSTCSSKLCHPKICLPRLKLRTLLQPWKAHLQLIFWGVGGNPKWTIPAYRHDASAMQHKKMRASCRSAGLDTCSSISVCYGMLRGGWSWILKHWRYCARDVYARFLPWVVSQLRREPHGFTEFEELLATKDMWAFGLGGVWIHALYGISGWEHYHLARHSPNSINLLSPPRSRETKFGVKAEYRYPEHNTSTLEGPFNIKTKTLRVLT